MLIIYVRGIGQSKKLLDPKEGRGGSIWTGVSSSSSARQRDLRDEEGEDFGDEVEIKRKCAQ